VDETLLVADNFNAIFTYWGSSADDGKGEALKAFSVSLGLKEKVILSFREGH